MKRHASAYLRADGISSLQSWCPTALSTLLPPAFRWVITSKYISSNLWGLIKLVFDFSRVSHLIWTSHEVRVILRQYEYKLNSPWKLVGWGSWGRAPHIINCGSRWSWVLTFTIRPFYPGSGGEERSLCFYQEQISGRHAMLLCVCVPDGGGFMLPLPTCGGSVRFTVDNAVWAPVCQFPWSHWLLPENWPV